MTSGRLRASVAASDRAEDPRNCMHLSRLKGALERALTDPAVEGDAAACRIGVTLLSSDPGPNGTEERITLWPGRDSAGHVVCRASAEVWRRVFTAVPAIGYQSFGALRRRPSEFTIDSGDLLWAQALPFMERLLNALRQRAVPRPDQPRHFDALRHLQGRYLSLAGPVNTWVYSEECGSTSAPVLLMLHTAGADARQWHGLMAQETLREQWRLMAFDLPAHGRSPLPAGSHNWTWRLDQPQYIDWVLRYLDAMQIERAALVGCSMGAAIGLPLLARHPDRFAGAILLETPYCSPGRRSPYLNHAEVHGARLSAAWVEALLSPSSPASGRDHATWIYSQAAPGVYDGDLAFYSDEFNAHQHTAGIDTTRTPLWLLTGDYDYSATPGDSRRVAEEIPGAHFQELHGFGHFPMVENPDGLMPYLAAPLQALRDRILQDRGNAR